MGLVREHVESLRTQCGGMSRRSWAVVTFSALAALVGWDLIGPDMALAALFGDGHGFWLRENVWLEAVFHQGARDLSWVVLLALACGVWWPWGFLQRLAFAQRAQMVVAVLAALLLVSVLKAVSLTSCPWDMVRFGGTAVHITHWALGTADGGGGHCFPAGHASAGFAFLAGWFALPRTDALIARRWLLASLVAGAVLGLSQQMRGAHFMSHTLWTAWLCWTTGGCIDMAFRAPWGRMRRSALPA